MRRLALGIGFVVVIAACGSSFTGSDQAGGDGSDGGGSEASVGDGGGGDPLMTGADAGPGGGGPQPGAEGGAPLDGIFVSAKSGKDANDGTMGAPLQTLTAAVKMASQFHKSVIACNETYKETLAVSDGTSVFGNYDCATNPKAWSLAATNAVLSAPVSPALTAKDIKTGTTIGHLDIVAPAAVGGQLNSIGALVNNSPGLELANLLITTGDAQNGTSGTDGVQLADDATVAGAGGTGGTNTCGGIAPYNGATGGNGGKTIDTCVAVTAVKANHTKSTTATKAMTNSYSGGGPGSGSNAAAGTFSPTDGYIPGDGTPGKNGNGGVATDGLNGVDYDTIDDVDNGASPVGGGKRVWTCMCSTNNYPGSCVGNNSATSTSTVGAAGAAGGCPGLAGKVGTGGGASIGIVSFDFAVTLTTVSIKTGKGGDAGKGTAGSAPGMGGAPPGTAGTQPGISGSGAGGPSVGVAWKDSAPNFVKGAKGTVTLGLAGAAATTVTSMDGLRTVPVSTAGAHADYFPIP